MSHEAGRNSCVSTEVSFGVRLPPPPPPPPAILRVCGENKISQQSLSLGMHSVYLAYLAFNYKCKNRLIFTCPGGIRTKQSVSDILRVVFASDCGVIRMLSNGSNSQTVRISLDVG